MTDIILAIIFGIPLLLALLAIAVGILVVSLIILRFSWYIICEIFGW
jgi:uncharacterized membrane protein